MTLELSLEQLRIIDNALCFITDEFEHVNSLAEIRGETLTLRETVIAPAINTISPNEIDL